MQLYSGSGLILLLNEMQNVFKVFRTNFAGLSRGIVYFGDDDNTYDWRLFDEIRSITLVGVWPVGIVGGLLVEAPILHDNCIIFAFAFCEVFIAFYSNIERV